MDELGIRMDERKKIGMMLHDDLAHELLMLQFAVLKEEPKLDGESFFVLNQKIDYIRKKIRILSHGLNSHEINNLLNTNISQFMKELLIDFSYFYNDLSFELNCYPKTITHIFNKKTFQEVKLIISEIIQNSVIHGKSSLILFNITDFEEYISIIVEDDGKGFDSLRSPQKKGIGIINCKNRIKNLMGLITWDSMKNKGTTVLIEIPKT
jgi:two-component system NarL family sensor kinase